MIRKYSPFFSGKNYGNSKAHGVEINLAELPTDPGCRIPILNYHPNVWDQVRRTYLQKDPCQPRGHNFPSKIIGNKQIQFHYCWFDEYPTLESSIEKLRCIAFDEYPTLESSIEKLRCCILFMLLPF